MILLKFSFIVVGFVQKKFLFCINKKNLSRELKPKYDYDN